MEVNVVEHASLLSVNQERHLKQYSPVVFLSDHRAGKARPAFWGCHTWLDMSEHQGGGLSKA
jgi:hypothetical protein